jgi:hypothetical protein
MPKFHIPIIAEVEAADIDEARRAATRLVESLSFKTFAGGEEGKITPTTLMLANDSQTARSGQRVVIIHPNECDADYSPEDYEARKLATSNEESTQPEQQEEN